MGELQFENEDDLLRWLEKQNQEIAITIAARSALRIVPILGDLLNKNTENRRKSIILPNFRAWVVTHSMRWGVVELETAAYSAQSALNALNARSPNTAYSAVLSTLSARSAVHFALSAARSAYSAARSAGSAAGSAGHSAVWNSVSEDANRGVGIPDENSRLWNGEPPEWVLKPWQNLRTALLSAEDEDWGVWTDWYEARLRGDPVNLDIDRAIALIPDEIWEQGPKVVNAEIRRLIDEDAAKKNRKLPLTIEQTRTLIEQDRLGLRFNPSGDHVEMDAADDPADARIEKTLPIMRMRAEQLCRAFAKANDPYQLDRRDEAQMFAEIVKQPLADVAENALILWHFSIGFGSAYELDSTERSKGGAVLANEQRSAIYTFLASSSNFVRLFPDVRAMDSENELHTGVVHRRELNIRIIESSVSHRILLETDAKILSTINEVAQAMTALSPRAANALDASQTNLLRNILLLAAGKAGLVTDAVLKQVGIDMGKHLALGEKAVSLVLSMKDALFGYVGTLPADTRGPMTSVIEELDSMDT